MDIFFTDPNEIPLPPEEVRIVDFKIDPYPDGHRVRVFLEFTPFLKKPNGDLTIRNTAGEPVAAVSFVEVISNQFEMTLHLRSFDLDDHYSAYVTLFYTLEVEDGKHGDQILVKPVKQIVDHKQLDFSLSGVTDSELGQYHKI